MWQIESFNQSYLIYTRNIFICICVNLRKSEKNIYIQSLARGHIWKRLPRLVDQPMHLTFDANEPLPKLLIDEVSRPADSMTEIRIRSNPV